MVRQPSISERGSTLSRLLQAAVITAVLALIVVEVIVTSRHSEGLQYPFADQAGPPEGTTKNVIDVPESWNKDLAYARAVCEARCVEFAGRIKEALTSKGSDEDKDRTLTLRMDRRVSFRILQEALLAGTDTFFRRYQFACRKGPHSRGTCFLTIDMSRDEFWDTPVDFPVDSPRPVSPAAPVPPAAPLTVLRLTADRLGGDLVYVCRADDLAGSPLKSLREVEEVIRKQRAKTPRLLLVFDARTGITVQQFVDVYNAAIKAGLKSITVAKPHD